MPTFAVTGSVKESGKPAAGAMLTLYPLDPKLAEEPWPSGFPHALVEADGTFKVSTYGEGDGAPNGEYAVLIRQLAPCSRAALANLEPDPDAPDSGDNQRQCDKFQGRYANPEKASWKVKVQGQAMQVPLIDVSQRAKSPAASDDDP